MKTILSGLLGAFGRRRGNQPPPVMSASGKELNIFDVLTEDCVSVDLQATTKEEAIKEMVDILGTRRKLEDAELCLSDVFARERIMSTGMQHGIALPHAKTDGPRTLRAAVGISKKGINFESVDGEPARIFILVLSPTKIAGPHVRFLAAVGAILKQEDKRRRLLDAASPAQVVSVLREEAR